MSIVSFFQGIANSQNTSIQSTASSAASAYGLANSATILAQSAYNQANTSGGGLDISGLTETEIDATDLIPVYDVTANTNKKSIASDIAGLGTGSIGYKTNNYYFAYLATGGSSTLPVTANRIYYVPFFVRVKTTFTRIGIQVSVVSTSGGTTARFGIYNAADGVPTSLVLDCGTVSTGTTGEKEATISATLNTGFYFLAIVTNGNALIWTTSNINQTSYAIGQSSRSSGIFYGYYADNGSTTLPDPAQTSLTLTTSTAAISLRVV